MPANRAKRDRHCFRAASDLGGVMRQASSPRCRGDEGLDEGGRKGPSSGALSPRMSTDRYICCPDQALAYSVGAEEILRLRASARTVLGPRFRLLDFHDQVLSAGAVPLGVLDQIIARWAGFLPSHPLLAER